MEPVLKPAEPTFSHPWDRFKTPLYGLLDRLITNGGNWGPRALDIATLCDTPELSEEITNVRVFHLTNTLLGMAGNFLTAKGFWDLSSGENPYLLPVGLASLGVHEFYKGRIGSGLRQKLKALYLANTLSLHPWILAQMRSYAIEVNKTEPFDINPVTFNEGVNSANEPPIISKYMHMVLDPILYAASSAGHLPPGIIALSAVASCASIVVGKLLQKPRVRLDTEHNIIRDSIGSVARSRFSEVLDNVKRRYLNNMKGYVGQDKLIGTINSMPWIGAAIHLALSIGDLTRWPGIINFYLRGHLSKIADNAALIMNSSYENVPGRVFRSYGECVRDNTAFFVFDRYWDKWRSTEPIPEERPVLDDDTVAQFEKFRAGFDTVHTSLTFDLKRQQITLLPIPSGGGKTTAILAALGLTVHHGDLYLNTPQGVKNLREMSRTEIARQVALVSTDHGIDPDSRIIDYYRELHLGKFIEESKEQGRVPTENELSIFTYQDNKIEIQLSLAYRHLVRKGVGLHPPEYYGIDNDGSSLNPHEYVIGEISPEEFEHLCEIRRERYSTVQDILNSFGDFMESVKPDSPPNKLSRGQLYTAMMSPHIYGKAKILVIDEVFASIDKKSLPQLLRQVFSLTTKFGISVVIINHGHQDIIERIANEFPMSNFQSIETFVDDTEFPPKGN